MIGVFLKSGLFARELLEMPFRAFRPAFLQALPKGMMALAVLFDRLTTENFTGAIGRKVDNTQVNTQDIRGSNGFRRGNVKGDGKVEDTLAIEQIGLPLDAGKARLLIPTDTKRNQHAARKRQQGDGRQSLEGHDPFIIDDCPFWLEGRFAALITFVGFTGFADAPDSQLSSQFTGCTQLSIHHFLQCKLVRCLLRKGDGGDIVGCFIKGMHGVKQCISLFRCRHQLQEHRLFHRTMVQPLMRFVNRPWEPVSLPDSPAHQAPEGRGCSPHA